MNISPKSISFDDDTLWVSLSDGRTIVNWNLTPISPRFCQCLKFWHQKKNSWLV